MHLIELYLAFIDRQNQPISSFLPSLDSVPQYPKIAERLEKKDDFLIPHFNVSKQLFWRELMGQLVLLYTIPVQYKCDVEV